MNISSCVSPFTRDRFANFQSTGKLGLEGSQRQELDSEKAAALMDQFQTQIGQQISADNVAGYDNNPKTGEIACDLGDDAKMIANFQGNTETGDVAVDIKAGDINSQAIASFKAGGMTIVQTGDFGNGGTGTLAAFLDPKGQSFIELHNVPDGAIGL